MTYDAIIVGGSFAGLSAATQLARAKRKVLVVDAGRPRNRFAAAAHGFLAQDGIPPGEILDTARRQLGTYPTVSFVHGEATGAAQHDDGFAIELQSGRRETGRRLILATGVVDHLPKVDGLGERWGRTVFHCPYCHGYELGDGPVAVLAVGAVSMHHAMMLPDWAPTTFFTNGAFEPDADERRTLHARGVTVVETAVDAVGDTEDGGIAVHLVDGRRETFRGLFVASRMEMAAPFAATLGCAVEHGPVGEYIRTNDMRETSVPGVLACGDTARMAGSVPFAVADGAMAGVAAHRSLIFETH
jgi:thioredoxin reductase